MGKIDKLSLILLLSIFSFANMFGAVYAPIQSDQINNLKAKHIKVKISIQA